MMKTFLITGLLTLTLMVKAVGQEREPDTVIVPLANSSKIIFIMKDKADLQTLKHYNFQGLFDDVLKRLEAADSTSADSSRTDEVKSPKPEEEDWDSANRENDSSDEIEDEEDHDGEDDDKKGRFGRTWQSSNIDLGMNNYLSSNEFPDGNELYGVRPWGSWYVGLNSIQRNRIAKNFFIEWGLGVSWYNFKFQKDNIIVRQDDNGVLFTSGTADVNYIKSKITATYINASVVPLLDLGNKARKTRLWDDYGSEFRFGVGPYVGYRIASKSKIVFEEDGNRTREKVRDNFYLNNIRYGVRMQMGFRATDFFLNYDLNNLFEEEKGPELNAISFGIIF